MGRLPCFHLLSSCLSTEEITSRQAAGSGEVGEELRISQNFRSIHSLVACPQRHKTVVCKLGNLQPQAYNLGLGCVSDQTLQMRSTLNNEMWAQTKVIGGEVLTLDKMQERKPQSKSLPLPNLLALCYSGSQMELSLRRDFNLPL